jgi:hypothetical protein
MTTDNRAVPDKHGNAGDWARGATHHCHRQSVTAAMTNRIEPALSAEEWARGIPGVFGWDDGSVFIDWREPEPLEGPHVDRPHAIIAALNAALPDSDPRKITRALVRRLRETAYTAADGYSGPTWLADLADALESYLPPEGV